MKLRCIIADDEPLAREILEGYIKEHPHLECIKSCKNGWEVMEFLEKEKADVLFLDINMPKLSGMSLLKTHLHLPKVILTTAYSEYALSSYEFGVSDYLLKPIGFERFVKSVSKVIAELTATHAPQTISQAPKNDLSAAAIFVRMDAKIVKVSLEEILYLEAYGNYVKIHLVNGQVILTKKTLTELESVLPLPAFLRVQRSFIIAIEKIQSIEGNMVILQQQAIPMSRQAKADLIRILGIDGE